jgi:hypothetical protein
MDFDLTKEQADIQKAAREFAKGEFDPELVLEYDRNQQFPIALWKKASEFGFTGVHYPEEFGGQGLGLFENALIVEVFCRQDSGMGIALALSDFGSELIVAHGNSDQKRKVLPAAAQGNALLTVAFSKTATPVAIQDLCVKKRMAMSCRGKNLCNPRELAELSSWFVRLDQRIHQPNPCSSCTERWLAWNRAHGRNAGHEDGPGKPDLNNLAPRDALSLRRTRGIH